MKESVTVFDDKDFIMTNDPGQEIELINYSGTFYR